MTEQNGSCPPPRNKIISSVLPEKNQQGPWKMLKDTAITFSFPITQFYFGRASVFHW